jgi:hypothetical protein
MSSTDSGLLSYGINLTDNFRRAAILALHVLAYNLSRVINIIGVQPLLAACGHACRIGFGSLGRVEDGRGSLGHAATLRFPSPLIGRVEDWRAGVGRSLCSLLSRPFVCECHSISTMPRFQQLAEPDISALRSDSGYDPGCVKTRWRGEPIE